MDTFSLAPIPTAKLVLSKFPDVEFTTQKVAIPSIRLIFPAVQAPQIVVPMPPNSVVYSPFELSFILLEDCSNYTTLVKWAQSSLSTSVANTFSDGSLLLLSSTRQVVQTVNFTDMMLIGLSELVWSTTENDVNYQTCVASFAYTSFAFQ